MGIVSRIQRFITRSTGDSGSSFSDISTGAPGFSFAEGVTSRRALKYTALYAGIRLRAENIGSLPKTVQRSVDGIREDAAEHEVFRVLHRPNGYTNGFNFWFMMNVWLDGWGNAYAVIERDGAGRVVALHQVHPSDVTVKMYKGEKWYKVQVSDMDFSWLNGVYRDYQMLHFMLVTYDGITGVNPIIENARAIGKGIAQQKFGLEYFDKGGNIKAVLETDKSLSDREFEEFRKHYNKQAQNFDTPILEYGIKYKSISVNPVAAQLIQSDTFSIQDISRILNIPPHMLGDLSHATFSNIEHQTIQFVQYSLRPTCKRIEVELEDKLFLDSERGRYHVKFVLDGLLRGDTAARVAYYHNAILDGWMSPNEAREMENMRAHEGLDYYNRPLNSERINEDGSVSGGDNSQEANKE